MNLCGALGKKAPATEGERLMVRMRDVWQRQTRGHGIGGVVWLLLILLPALGHAEQFTGKVVGISDGDTLNVLREGKAVKVRLHGIDTPERAQAFGTRAQQFTSELAFGNEVTVVVRDTDRYGRVVGEVRLPEPDGRNLNQELVKAGMAWWYKQYAPNDTTLAQLEADARAAQRGLWAEAHPVPPWAWRRGERAPARVEGPAASPRFSCQEALCRLACRNAPENPTQKTTQGFPGPQRLS